MKIISYNRERGSVLITGLIVALAAGITLASYLMLISNRYRMTVRSMDWNKAMPVLESGIEEALAHLHDDFTHLTLNGWTAGTFYGYPVFNKFRTNSDGSYFWTVIITNGMNGYITNPIIFSSGFVPVPLGKGYISRTVEVTTSRPVEFANAVAATGNITFNGNNASVDAYNSCNGAYGGTNSQLSTSLVTDSTASGAINMGNGNMYGTLNTGPGGTISANSQSSIGDSSWVSNHTGIEAGYTNDTMNVSFPTNFPPAGSQNWFAPQTTNGVTVLGNNNYQMSSLSSSSSNSPVIVNGNATLYVSGNLSLSGTGDIEILPGATLTVYVAGNASIGGKGIVNDNSSPENFSYIGLASNTSISFSGQATFYGTINAPQADFSMGGNAEVFGAAIVKSFTNGGNAWFHYDQCAGLLGNLVVMSWRETL